MQRSKTQACITHILQLIQEKVPFKTETLRSAEKELNITLPNDFIELGYIHRYDYLDSFEFYNWRNDEKFSVISKTKALRECYPKFTQEYLILAEEDDVSVVLMRITSTESAQVIWCAMEDFMNLLEGRPMEYNPTIFNSFVDFYEFLLDKEEERRSSEAN